MESSARVEMAEERSLCPWCCAALVLAVGDAGAGRQARSQHVQQ